MTDTTKRSKRPQRKTGKLKMFLLTSSLLATLAGTHLLNIQAAGQEIATAAVNNEPIIVIESAPDTLFLTPNNGSRQQISLKPIPQTRQLQLRPIARTRSFR